jgi:hypothetical protein
MSTLNISDLEFVTRESLASDFKASGSALPPNTAIVDVRKQPSFTYRFTSENKRQEN